MAVELTFNEVIRQIANGEDVSASITNRPIAQLDNNVRYLRELLAQFSAGSTVIARDQLIESAALTGMPVFFNVLTNQFERALGTVELDAVTGAAITGPATQVLGIVYARQNSTTGDVLLAGMADVDMDSAIDGTITAGIYYLSNAVAGKLVKQRPPVGVSVLQVAGETADSSRRVFVNVKFHDLLESHRHYKFELAALPAGTVVPPDVDEPHTIEDADNSLEGWLPADDESFDGNAPAGAVFGYNIQAAAWRTLWPPQPASGAYLEWSRGGNGEVLGMGVTSQLCVIDRFGIWWMTGCYDRVPWPTDLDNSSSLSESEASGECPLELLPRLTLWFTRPVFNNTGTWVSSLQPAAGSGLTVRCVDTNADATTGHLVIGQDLSLTVSATPATGYQVLKRIEDNQFQQGPVVESVKAVGSNVTVASDVTIGSDGKAYGNVSIAVDQDLNAGEVGVDVVRLSGVEEEYFSNVMGLGFVKARRASLRSRIAIPTGIELPAGTKLKLVFWLLNRSSATIPAELFSLTYRRVPNPGSTPIDLPLTDTDLASVPASNIAVTAVNQYVSIESEPFTVAAGDQVLFQLERAGDEDGFNADLYILKQFGKYVEG